MELYLTKREFEIIKLTAKGYTNSKIAKKLCISEHTVKFHLENIFRKLNCHSRIEAAITLIRKGILNL